MGNRVYHKEMKRRSYMRPMVYVAGPYSLGDPVVNTRNAMDAWMVLIDAGFTPVCPHVSLFMHLVYPHEPDFWYEYDLRLLERCDAMLRLSGESPGADGEERFAEMNGIPVFHGEAHDFAEWYEQGYIL
jgi:hypothetical protein